MKHLKKIFEDFFNTDGEEVKEVESIIEDTLIDYNINIRLYTIGDGESDSALQFSIREESEYPLISTGNPYSDSVVDIEKFSQEQVNHFTKIYNFTNDFKSLCYRLDKSGYLINFISYQINDNKIALDIHFLIERGKFKRI